MASFKDGHEARGDERLWQLTEILLEKTSHIMNVGVLGDGLTRLKSRLSGEREGGRGSERRRGEGERCHTLRAFCLATEPAFLKIPSLDERSSRKFKASTKNLLHDKINTPCSQLMDDLSCCHKVTQKLLKYK